MAKFASLTRLQKFKDKMTALISAHINNTTVHIQTGERDAWDSKADKMILIDSDYLEQANYTPAEILQAAWAGNILMAIGGVCTLMSYDPNLSYVILHRQYNEPNQIMKIQINADKSYTVELVELAGASDLTSHASNTDIHITAEERKKWNGKADTDHTHTTVKNSKYLETWNTNKSSTYDDQYKAYAWWETGSICKFVVDGYKTKVDMAIQDSNGNNIANTYATKPTVVMGTLSAGSTSLTLSNSAIKTDSVIDVYTDVFGVNPTGMTVSAGSIALTFDAQTSTVNIRIEVK